MDLSHGANSSLHVHVCLCGYVDKCSVCWLAEICTPRAPLYIALFQLCFISFRSGDEQNVVHVVLVCEMELDMEVI